MKLFIFGKEAQQIREEARSSQRKIDAVELHRLEEHYLQRENKTREQYSKDKEMLNKAHMKDIENKEKLMAEQYEEEIKKLRSEVTRRDVQLKNSQGAWELFKGLLPEVKNFASVLETKALAVSLEKNKDLALAREMDNRLGLMIDKMRLIEPDMNKLLSYDDTTIGINKYK